MPTQTRRRSSTRRRQPKLGAVSGVWFALTLVFGLLTLVIESTTLIVTTALTLLVAIVSLFAGQHVAVPAKPAAARKGTTPGGKPKPARAPAKAGTTGSRKFCGARCRRSTKPKDTCDCVCRGGSHGSESGRTFASSRAGIKSKAAKAQERKHVRENEGWRRG